MPLMMSSNVVSRCIIFIFFTCIHLSTAPYPKYHISEYCGSSSKGTVIKLGDSQDVSGKSSLVAMLKLKRETYRQNLDCYVKIQAPRNYGIIALVKKIKLREFNSVEDTLQVSADKDNSTSKTWYGNNEESSPHVTLVSKSSSGQINVRFKSGDFALSLPGKGFRIILTVYTAPSLSGNCGENSSLRLDCLNKMCVSEKFECDGVDNCGNYKDELNCGVTSESAIGVIVFVGTLTAMVVLVLFFIVKSKKRREKFTRGFSSVYRGGRRLSLALQKHNLRRNSADPTPANISPSRSDDLQYYASLPVIYSHMDLQETLTSNDDPKNKLPSQ